MNHFSLACLLFNKLAGSKLFGSTCNLLVSCETTRKSCSHVLLTRHASTSVPGQTKLNHLFQKSWSTSGSKACWVNILVERQVLRHSCRALAHARANVYAPTWLSLPMLATTPPRWGTRWEVVRFSRAGCMPSQDVVLPLRSMVTFAFFPVLVNVVPGCSLMCAGTRS